MGPDAPDTADGSAGAIPLVGASRGLGPGMAAERSSAPCPAALGSSRLAHGVRTQREHEVAREVREDRLEERRYRVNVGTLRAPAGGLRQVSGTEADRGTLDAGGGTLVLPAAAIEGGTVAATSGGTIIATGGVAPDGTAAPEALPAGTVVTVSKGQSSFLLGTLANSGESGFAPSNGAATLLVARAHAGGRGTA